MSQIYVKNEPIQKESTEVMYLKGFLRKHIELKIDAAIKGATTFFGFESTKEFLNGLTEGKIKIITKPDFKMNNQLIRIPNVTFAHLNLKKEGPYQFLSGTDKLYETSISYEDLIIVNELNNIEKVIKHAVKKIASSEEERQWN